MKILFLLTLTTAMSHAQVTDNGVLINGIHWATRNVDTPGTFAATPQCTGHFYQWNRRTAWRASSATTGWNSTIATATGWKRENDPCPSGWRVPTLHELELLAQAAGEWENRYGVYGRVFGTAPYQLFLPASGRLYSSNGAFFKQGVFGGYWSSRSSGGISARYLNLFGTRLGSLHRGAGLSVRCVRDF